MSIISNHFNRSVFNTALVAGILSLSSITQAQNFVDGEVLIKFKKKAATAQSHQLQAQSFRAFGVNHHQTLGNTGYSVFHIPSPLQTLSAISEIERSEDVESVQPNYIYHASALPDDPDLDQLWGLKNSGQTIGIPAESIDALYPTNNPGTSGLDMNLEPAWDLITDCSSTVVAVLDTGIQYNHQDLKDNMWNGGSQYPYHGYDFIDNDNNPIDSNSHGTHVAGTIGAVGNNGLGIAGVCWKVQLMAVRVLNTLGSGSSSAIISGVDFAIQNKANVINMSLGGAGLGSDMAFQQILQDASDAGIAIIVAAGNSSVDNDNSPNADYPCSFTIPNLVCVAALDQSYDIADFSNYGITKVHVGAPGTNVLSSIPGRFEVFGKDTPGTAWTNSTSHNWEIQLYNGYEYLNYPNGYSSVVSPNTYIAGNAAVSRQYNFPPGGDVLTFSYFAKYNTPADAGFRTFINANGVDAFAGTQIAAVTGTTSGEYRNRGFVTSQCLNKTCAVGFRFEAGSNGTSGQGVSLVQAQFKKLTFTNTNYSVYKGTSMASPHVAGLAAMLFAYNPQYLASDVVESIKNSGVDAPHIATKTSTGKAVDAFAALKYIKTPSNVQIGIKQ
ncbi:S8 family serine peptidase [Pseudobdellovibrio exovorus]|uniref:Peptidase S8 n=1 Tax=Pseudobdellovibrio exovorus JSS TaxID=1184267 RepID=M4VN58_9BACT|nr:S8 family serine peptidase [Pseudobdellovibrio exovorus]AGH94504.1 hypothetical protein A11Q_284 [Pseudobdellovibrio exovorus JSS]